MGDASQISPFAKGFRRNTARISPEGVRAVFVYTFFDGFGSLNTTTTDCIVDILVFLF
jgi:hypothetical protein